MVKLPGSQMPFQIVAQVLENIQVGVPQPTPPILAARVVCQLQGQAKATNQPGLANLTPATKCAHALPLQGEERRSVNRKLQRLHDFSSKAVLRGGTEDNGNELFALYRLLVPGVGACTDP